MLKILKFKKLKFKKIQNWLKLSLRIAYEKNYNHLKLRKMQNSSYT
jgi:hypothetical protein